MKAALIMGIIGDHFFCFRAINDVACLIKACFKVFSICRKLFESELAAQGARGQDGFVAKLIPEAKAWLELLAELR
ncbi:hypothetical protein APX01_19670 (plasmid) [Cereibacter sphaeroides]|nr:hypothetical protein APX01_19670 [Cereibacter sphaeroides]ANS36542.1 hypothetical protein A3858_19950 [Cereibacter sphaeroides]ATN65554.1 hypothetical protein A3857_19695 [Cereibacter sphaeroides]